MDSMNTGAEGAEGMAFGETRHEKDARGTWFTVPYIGSEMHVYVARHTHRERPVATLYWAGEATLADLDSWLATVFMLSGRRNELSCRYQIWAEGDTPEGIYDLRSFHNIERDLTQWVGKSIITLTISNSDGSGQLFHCWADLAAAHGVEDSNEVGLEFSVDGLCSSESRSIISLLIRNTMRVRPTSSDVEQLLDLLGAKLRDALASHLTGNRNHRRVIA
jgi:hypothetical protein